MSFLVGLLKSILPTILDWIVGRLKPILKSNEENNQLKDRQEGRLTQAEKVEALRIKILELHSAGLPVPQELKDELRNESLKLIESQH